ncbi:MAG TPA: hypothetical protein VLU24_07910, partial [Mycobacterium sp.]|nr:hypothetical protein [Mycobacterium sp.]
MRSGANVLHARLVVPVVCPVVALFAAVEHTITAEWRLAIGTTGIRDVVAIASSTGRTVGTWAVGV